MYAQNCGMSEAPTLMNAVGKCFFPIVRPREGKDSLQVSIAALSRWQKGLPGVALKKVTQNMQNESRTEVEDRSLSGRTPGGEFQLQAAD
jgi:hypothetical protein